MTERVVDRGEMVYVQEHQGKMLPCSTLLLQHRRQLLDQEVPVGKAGQGVEIRLAVEALIEALARGDVLLDGDEVHHLSGAVPHRGHAGECPVEFAVLTPLADLPGPPLPGLHGALQLLVGTRRQAPGSEQLRQLSKALLRGKAGYL